MKHQLGTASGALRYVSGAIFIIREHDAQSVVATPDTKACTHALPSYLSANSANVSLSLK